MALSVKQTVFINEYLKTFNATKAAKLAGYSGNENTLAVTGYELLRNPKISEAISQRLSETAMSADEVLRRLGDQARGDMGDFWDIPEKEKDGISVQNGSPTLNLIKAKDKLHLIKKMKVKTTTRTVADIDEVTTEIDFELYDAQTALEKLGRHHKLFVEQLEAKIDDKLDDAARTARIMALLNAGRERRDRQAPESGPDDLASTAGATD